MIQSISTMSYRDALCVGLPMVLSRPSPKVFYTKQYLLESYASSAASTVPPSPAALNVKKVFFTNSIAPKAEYIIPKPSQNIVSPSLMPISEMNDKIEKLPVALPGELSAPQFLPSTAAASAVAEQSNGDEANTLLILDKGTYVKKVV